MFVASTSRQSHPHAYVGPIATTLLRSPGLPDLHVAGDVSLLDRPAVAVVGSRAASDAGVAHADAVARELVVRGYVVMSGLAAGIDAAAHVGAIAAGGRTMAVIGTSLDKAYPAEHAALQERVYREHLLVSPFAPGSKMARWHYPARNRAMARLARATVLVEAAEASGTRHQVAECVALGRTVYARRGLVAAVRWLRGAPAGRVVEWADAAELGELVAAEDAERGRVAS
jgi:DNA processing protein